MTIIFGKINLLLQVVNIRPYFFYFCPPAHELFSCHILYIAPLSFVNKGHGVFTSRINVQIFKIQTLHIHKKIIFNTYFNSLRHLTSLEDKINRPNSSLQHSIASNMKTVTVDVKSPSFSNSVMNGKFPKILFFKYRL